MRSILTMLGIVIGICAVTLMATAMEGVNQAFDRSAAAFGTDVLYVQKFPWVSDEDWETIRNRPNMKVQYADQIDRKASLLASVSPVMTTRRTTWWRGNVMEGTLISGTTAEFLNSAGVTLGDGRFFTNEESKSGKPVCAIGAVVAETLFPKMDPIGQTIRVAGIPYNVVGVFEKQGGLFGEFTSDLRVYVPLISFQGQFGGRRDVSIQVRVADQTQMENAKIELEGIVRTLRGLEPGEANNFNINQQEVLTDTFDPISRTIAMIGLFITGLALFVGGIGIMNIMFVSVTERTREIGIRKAIGAPRRSILLQFLIEASILCLIAGLIGLLIAYVASLIVDQLLIPTALPFSVVFLAIFISIVVGVVSGFLPAFKASKMDPVEALRYE
jgi:putative ABC transport system permease protein